MKEKVFFLNFQLLLTEFQGTSDYLVVFLRLLTSMQIRLEADFYQVGPLCFLFHEYTGVSVSEQFGYRDPSVTSY